MTIDLDGIGQRIVALPIRAANYIELDAGKTGILFLSEIVDVPRFSEPPAVTVSKFDLSTRKTEPYRKRSDATLRFRRMERRRCSGKDRRQQDRGSSLATAAAPKPGEGALNLGEMEVYVDPARGVEPDVPRSVAD